MDIGHLRELEPAVEAGYLRHTRNDTRPVNPSGPLNPTLVLQQATDSVGENITVAHEGIAESARENRNKLDQLQVDYWPLMRSTNFVNLLTEDNLIHYHEALAEAARLSEPFRMWRNRWSSEEARHSMIIYQHAIHAGIIGEKEFAPISHAEYSESLATQHIKGMEIEIDDLYYGACYLTLQEDSTVVSHKNELALEDIVGIKAKKRVVGDENNHTVFYHDLEQAAVENNPDAAAIGIAKNVRHFVMPGRLGILGFEEHAERIAVAGIFDHSMIDGIMKKHIRKWGILDATMKTDEGKKAQAYLNRPSKYLRMQKSTDRKREQLIENYKQNGGLAPFILGRTVEMRGTELVRLDF